MSFGSRGFWKKWKRTREVDSQGELPSEQSPAKSDVDEDSSDPLGEHISRASNTGQSRPIKGQLGLALIAESPAPNDGQRDFPVDIVFVHGLNGDVKDTWTHENGIFWPRDLLPATLPGARIFSFGYDSKIFFSTSTSEFRDFALSLLRDLHYLGHSTNKVQPIIFVCHSLGGIVVKEAINVAYERNDHEVLDRTKGVVFLGTPHRGSGIAAPAALLSGILTAVWSPVGFVVPGPRKKLISDLERSSRVLFAIGDRFTRRSHNLEITSFYETNLTLPLRKVVVDQSSGVLGLESESSYPIPTNHHDICRFNSRESIDYKAVASAIREMIAKIIPLREGSESQHSLTSSEKECIQHLNTVDLVEFESQIDERSPDTLLWLSKDTNYISWLTDASAGVFLVTGYPGCGKTVLASYLRTQLLNDFRSTSLVCRFYCRATVEKMHSAVELMRCIIHQIVSHSHEMLRVVVKAANRDQWLWSSFERLWTLFENIVSSDKTREIIVIIDAIDELEERIQRQVAPRILHLVQSQLACSVKFFITSQPQAVAVAALRPCSLCLVLEDKHELIGDDVNLFIKERVEKLAARKVWTDGIQRRLVEALRNIAGQSFLWVALTISSLETRHILNHTDLEDALSTIPPDLAKFYDRSLKLIVDQELPGPAIRLLNIVLSSFRPLHVDELGVLLSINESHGSIAEARRDQAIKGIQSIQQALGPLATSHYSKIQLVHSSLKDHLINGGWKYGLEERIGHELLAERCILYLLLHDFNDGSVDTTSSPELLSSPTLSSVIRGGHDDDDDDSDSGTHNTFFEGLFSEPEHIGIRSVTMSGFDHELYEYAIRYWAAHFEQSQVSETSLAFSLAKRLYTDFSQAQWNDILRDITENHDEFPSNPDPLTLACFYGHYQIAQQLLHKQGISDHQIGRALYWSASRGYTRCVELVVPYVQSMFDKSLCCLAGCSPLAAAAANGRMESVEFLIKTAMFGINEQDTKGMTALSLATSRAQEYAVFALISMEHSRDLNVNLPDKGGRSALFWAVSSNSSRIVKALLQDGRVEKNLLDFRKRSALSWACEDGLADIVKLFVDNTAVELGTQDDNGNTPLIHAVKSKDWGTVKNLFRRSRRSVDGKNELNIAAKDREGRNAISWAASTDSPRILELLLAHGSAEASSPDYNGWPPLAWSMDPPGFPQNAMLLIPHCLGNINDQDYLGSSLLSTAISWGQLKIARLLIENTELEVDQRNADGRTALSFAASTGSLDLVKLLVEHRGADASIVDDTGNLPLHWAQKLGQIQVADYLDGLRVLTNCSSSTKQHGAAETIDYE